jgi:polysaccharide export outer membrane protein
MRNLLLIAVCFVLAACADGFTTFPVDEGAQDALEENVTIVRLDASNIGNYTTPARAPTAARLAASNNWEYRVGPGDILSVTVFGHPDLTTPAGAQRSAADSGFAVQADGSFFYPFIGTVMGNNRRVSEIREEIAERLAEFIPDPQVEVRVAAFNSQSVLVSGEVNAANTQFLNAVPLTLLGAINAAGGMTDEADPARITLRRGDRIAHIDLNGFLERGYRQNNPVLRNGDIVNIPQRRTLEAFLLGEVSDPDTVDLSMESVTLTQALTRQGGLTEVRADARGIFVFRDMDEKMTVYQLDTSSPTGLLLGTKFVLEAGDVVYVTRSPLQRWNDTISRILPTVQAVSAVDALRD